ncbi:MAG: hypothetical protein KAS07_00845 [Candidatus Pacebacteria bacterium]|nr:hypothetical protein [Candidatus Paceibacterota bacterium]
MSNTVSMGNWKLEVGETRFLHETHVQKLTQLVEEWSSIETFIRKKDATPVWSVQNLNVPTILCRVDMTPFEPDDSPEKGLFEVEARPAGFGILLNLFPEFKNIRAFWEPLAPVGAVVLGSREVAAEDTRVFSKAMGWKWFEPQHCGNGIAKHVWVRGSELDNKSVDLSRLEKRALAPVTSHGDKTYLLKMGLATPVHSPDELSWDTPFVVKPQKGSKSDCVLLWHPQEKKKKTNGLYTKTKITNTLGQDRPFIKQSFMFPQEEKHQDKRGFTIWRIYFGYDIRTSKWRFAGGLWNWRPCLKVHGALDSIAGGLMKKTS